MVMAAILKVWRHIRNQTKSIDACLREEQVEQPSQISSRSDLNRRSYGFLKYGAPNKKKNNNNMMTE